MTDTNDIRSAAVHCEVKKCALRQTQDGIVVSFVLHPQEVPDELTIAPLGTRYMLALVKIGDDELPVRKEVVQHTGQTLDRPNKTPPAPVPPASGRAKRSFDDMPPSQQAGMLCADPGFQIFLCETFDFVTINHEGAADFVRLHCHVESRSALDTAGPAGWRWRELVTQYRAWQRAPEVVPG